MQRPARLDSVYVVAAVVMAAAALFEAGYGGPEAELTALSAISALLTGLAVLVARWTPLGAIVLLAAVVACRCWSCDLPPSGGAQLIVWMLLVGNAAYRLPRSAGWSATASLPIVPRGHHRGGRRVGLGVPVLRPDPRARLGGRGAAAPRAAPLRRARRAGRGARHEREKQAEVAVAAERTRISRELHDAVAHTVSVMTLQVGVVRRRLDAGTVEEETLRGAETLGRQAVDELRRIVGLVREGESAALAPLPSLAQLDELVTQVRGTGTSVAVEVTGPVAEVPQAVDMSAYRIVQEGLTNALRHAPGAPVEVRVAVGPGDVEVDVRTVPPASRSRRSTAGGHGLVGIRERVHVLGGALTASGRRAADTGCTPGCR